MKPFSLILRLSSLLGIAASIASPAFGQANGDIAELAKARNCMTCHHVDRRVVGPAFKDIAGKYAGQKDAVDKLAQKVLSGGAGAWGVVAMPANRQVSEAEAKQLVGWILTLK